MKFKKQVQNFIEEIEPHLWCLAFLACLVFLIVAGVRILIL
jgi:hypothetical protein